jgi:hypothetical protein
MPELIAIVGLAGNDRFNAKICNELGLQVCVKGSTIAGHREFGLIINAIQASSV